jgi:hypothetical protein
MTKCPLIDTFGTSSWPLRPFHTSHRRQLDARALMV